MNQSRLIGLVTQVQFNPTCKKLVFLLYISKLFDNLLFLLTNVQPCCFSALWRKHLSHTMQRNVFLI